MIIYDAITGISILWTKRMRRKESEKRSHEDLLLKYREMDFWGVKCVSFCQGSGFIFLPFFLFSPGRESEMNASFSFTAVWLVR